MQAVQCENNCSINFIKVTIEWAETICVKTLTPPTTKGDTVIFVKRLRFVFLLPPAIDLLNVNDLYSLASLLLFCSKPGKPW